MYNHEFKEFDRVLAKDPFSKKWYATIFSHFDIHEMYPFRVSFGGTKECIPYNETTKHLIGTTYPYAGPTELPVFKFGDVVRWTDDEHVKRGIFCTGPDEDWECEVLEEGDSASVSIKIRDIKLIRKGNFNE